MNHPGKKLYMVAMFFLIVGGLAWGYMAIRGKNPVAKLGKWAVVIYALVGLSAVALLFVGRDVFLPFLGPTVLPCAALQERVPEGADTTVHVQVRPGAKVVYWGAEPDTESLNGLKTWQEAYAGYKNVGVTTADANGMATLRLRTPQPYEVPFKGRLESHVHYRMCMNDGWLTQVETAMISSEPFENQEQPQPQPPVQPLVANTPELPVIADPVSGLPTAVPASVVPAEAKEPKKESMMEGFSNEPLYSSAEGEQQSMGTLQSEEPRLQQLRTTIESDANHIVDEMAYGASGCGTDLDAAFAAPPPTTAMKAWSARLQ